MKKLIFFCLIFIQTVAFSQQTTLKVVGKNLTLTNGQNIILRGVNYPFIDDGALDMTNPVSYKSRIDELAKTGANCIRIMWYTDGSHWRDRPADGGTPGTMNGYVNNGHLNNAVAYCITKNMIPILEIHNLTGSDDWVAFENKAMNFWRSPAIRTLIENNKSKIIINLANEFGYILWTPNPAAASIIFKNNYNAAIASLRNLNINVPIMIDAPEYGTSSTELLSIAESMNASDSQNNLIFSAHTYWANYANTLPQVLVKLNEAQNTNVCFVLGELPNTQDDDIGNCGVRSLDPLYRRILEEACPRNIGWIAWAFHKDCSPPRNMTPNGQYNNLTAFGNDIVNNATYGLKSTGNCGATSLSNKQFEMDSATISIYPNPSSGRFSMNMTDKIKKISCHDVLGKQVDLEVFDDNTFQIKGIAKGVHFLKIEFDNGSFVNKKIVLK